MICVACGRWVYDIEPIVTRDTTLVNMPDQRDVWHRVCYEIVNDPALTVAEAARLVAAIRERRQ